MICEFNYIELVSDEDVYVLENTNRKKIQKSEWIFTKINSEERREIESEKRWDLNCLIESNLKYRAFSRDKSVLCLYMPKKDLSSCVRKIEGLLK